MAAVLRLNTGVMLTSTSGRNSHISGWCGSNRNTGGAPSGGWADSRPRAWATARARIVRSAATGWS